MTFRIIYNQDYKRIIPAVLIDSRGLIPDIQETDGFATKNYTDSVVNMVNEDTVPYKIETDTGNLVGYFNILVGIDGNASLMNSQIRPAFQNFDAEISQLIITFIASNDWVYDFIA